MGFEVKACIKCGLVQSLENYYKHAKMLDGTINECKTCTVKRTSGRVRVQREVLNELKTERGCMDCGYNANPVALQFDHTEDNKEFTIGRCTGYSMERLLAEVAKCEVVCANCHHIRTHRRLQDE